MAGFNYIRVGVGYALILVVNRSNIFVCFFNYFTTNHELWKLKLYGPFYRPFRCECVIRCEEKLVFIPYIFGFVYSYDLESAFFYESASVTIRCMLPYLSFHVLVQDVAVGPEIEIYLIPNLYPAIPCGLSANDAYLSPIGIFLFCECASLGNICKILVE